MKHRKKTLSIVSSLYGGGAEKAVLTLSRTLNRLGHTSHVVSVEGTVHYDVGAEQNVHVLEGGTKNALGIRSYGRQARRLRRLVDRLESADGRRFDLVFSHLIVASNVVARCGLGTVYHCVHNSVEGSLRQARGRGLMHYLVQRSRLRALDGKHLITVSRGLQHELETSSVIRPASVRTIYNPVEIDTIRRLAREDIAGIPEGDYLIHVGRAARQKRHDILFEAFKHVPERYRLVLMAGRTERLRRVVAEPPGFPSTIGYGWSPRMVQPSSAWPDTSCGRRSAWSAWSGTDLA